MINERVGNVNSVLESSESSKELKPSLSKVISRKSTRDSDKVGSIVSTGSSKHELSPIEAKIYTTTVDPKLKQTYEGSIKMPLQGLKNLNEE